MPRGRGVRCAGMTGDYLVWCTREQYAGNAPLDVSTSPVAFRHHRYGWCPCGVEHQRQLPRPDFPILRIVEAPPSVNDLILRHQVYTFALSLLDLRADALADLTRRGLTREPIDAVGYRSVPADFGARTRFLATLVGEFGEDTLRQVPGFVDKHRRLFFWVTDGYVVPYRDEEQRITGFQLKSFLKGKYLTAFGTKVADLYHVAGPVQPGGDVYVTEGGLKAQVAAWLGNVAVVGVPGQALKDTHIAAIRRLQPGRVITALDWE